MEARFRRSFYPNYFSLEDIMATQERVPCKVEMTLRGLGCVDPSTVSEDLVAGTAIQLPYWLASPLCHHRIKVLSTEVPKIYKESFREIFSADASIVDLHKMLYFYEFGMYISRLNHRDSNEINHMIMNAFKDRLRVIMDWAQNLCTDVPLIQKLDTLEKQLYKDGYQSRMQLCAWLNDGSSKIAASEMVVNHKKRKRAEIDL